MYLLKAERMYEGVVNANVLERFRPIAKDALTRVIREIVRRSISAMEQEAAQQVGTVSMGSTQPRIATSVVETESTGTNGASGAEPPSAQRHTIETTERELQVFETVKAMFERSSFAGTNILDAASRKAVPIEIAYKDTTGYFGIYFNKPSYWIMRIVIEGRKNWVGFNIDDLLGTTLIPAGMVKLEPHPHADFRIQINGLEDFAALEKIIVAAFAKTIGDRTKTTF